MDIDSEKALTTVEVEEIDVDDSGDEEEKTAPLHLNYQKQRDVFEEWKQDRIRSMIANVGEGPGTTSLHQDDTATAHSLLPARPAQKIVNTPRDYQIELFQRAKIQNTIAVLDTGSGKTLIAVLLLRHIIDQELEDRALGKDPRISFFVVDRIALAYQQHSVLQTNLDQPSAAFTSGDSVKLWGKEFWLEQFRTQMVIVCTADVLDQCLFHSFISMTQINIMILDEAHHAKKGHTYARLMKTYYTRIENPQQRPRIFAMTASPVDAGPGDDIPEQARALEILLHSSIATTSHLSLASCTDTTVFVADQVETFHSLGPPFETHLLKQLKQQCCSILDMFKAYSTALYISNMLGSWSVNTYLAELFIDEITTLDFQLNRNEVKRALQEAGNSTGRRASNLSTQLLTARAIVRCLLIQPPGTNAGDVSSKVLALRHILDEHFQTASNRRCIVFVERKVTAQLLNSLFSHFDIPHLRRGYLIGHGSKDGLVFSSKQQARTLLGFRRGDINCLFATSVAEEGLDIPECNLVIRFDPCKTPIQYIQSRGRARQKDSKFIHMMEAHNWREQEAFRTIKAGVAAIKHFCNLLPDEKKLLVDFEDDKAILSNDPRCRWYEEPNTGATLSYDNSLMILSNYARTLCLDLEEEDMQTQPYYCVWPVGIEFTCEVVLPPNSPVPRATGNILAKKSLAKRSAAFEACLQLKKLKLLDQNLISIYSKKIPELRNKSLALNGKCDHEYPFKLKPDAWNFEIGKIPDRLHVTVVTLLDQWDRPTSPLGLVTRARLPQLPLLSIFRLGGNQCRVSCASNSVPIVVEQKQVEALTAFSLRIYSDLFNKHFEFEPRDIPYWLAPLTSLREVPDGLVPAKPVHIDWELAQQVCTNTGLRWNAEMESKDFIDCYAMDPLTGKRRFFINSIAESMKATDDAPIESATVTKRAKHARSILDYSTSLSRSARAKQDWDPEQPVFHAELLSHRLNVLAKPTEEERSYKSECYICLEPLLISPIPKPIAAMCLLFPAIIHRIESSLIASEFVDELALQIRPELALEAITKEPEPLGDVGPLENANQAHTSGNYERLEFIGDCFLKMAVSIALFAHNAGKTEEDMHIARMMLVCNQNLYNVATKAKWHENIRASGFQRRTWYPSTLKLIKGKGVGKQDLSRRTTQIIGDKTIADVCEAMIGAALMSHMKAGFEDFRQFDEAIKAVTKVVNNDSHTMTKWEDYYQVFTMPSYFLNVPRAFEVDLARKIALKCGYHFANPRILACAFNDPSHTMHETGLPSYQRLEFLGDALHDMICVHYLVGRYGNRDPQWLTEHKMAMATNQFLGALGVKLGFHTHLRFMNSSLRATIQKYVDDIKEAEIKSPGSRNVWTMVKDAPKCLADVVEAYIGAVFLDSRFNLAKVKQFFDAHIRWYFEDIQIYDNYASNHPITRLNHLLAVTMGCQSFRIMADEVVFGDGITKRALAGLVIHDEVVAEGRAKSVRYAKEKASYAGIQLVKDITREQFKEQFCCNCGQHVQSVPESKITQVNLN